MDGLAKSVILCWRIVGQQNGEDTMNSSIPAIQSQASDVNRSGPLQIAAALGGAVASTRPGRIPRAAGDNLKFGRFTLLPAQRLLLEDTIKVPLGARALDILIALAARPDEVVTKQELIARVWPDTFVEAVSLRVHMTALRKALHDGDGRLICTVPGRGYRLVTKPARSMEPPPPTALSAPPVRMLPVAATKLIGRAAFVDDVVSQLPERRLMTIVGPGGIGKTRVAIASADALAASYRDGVGFVDLTRVTHPTAVAAALAGVLGVAISSRDPIRDLMSHLRDREMLLVIDNCEHVIDAAAELVEAISAGAQGVHILATSREALRVSDEWVRILPPLPSPLETRDLTAAEALKYPAVRLFVERAAAVQEGFKLSDADAPAVGEICRRLDGVALAIELAAASLDVFGIAWLAAHLDERLCILKRGRRTAAARHQTLVAMLDWSYELLSEQERAMLHRVARFGGEFTLSAAIDVAASDGIRDIQAIDAVGGLVSKSLATAYTSGSVTRYRLPETTRVYAGAKLKAIVGFGVIAANGPPAGFPFQREIATHQAVAA
jgi:predicted ATPase/DNA-binding winged helix-turn-helix (wHTH) protein